MISLLIGSLNLNAQKVKVENNIENIGDGYNVAFHVTIPYAKIKPTTKTWTNFLKDNHAKVKTPKGAINAQYMVINGMGSDSITVFSRITDDENGCVLIAAFQRKGVYVSPTTDSIANDLISKLLRDMGKDLALNGIKENTEDATDILTKKTKEQAELTKTNQSKNSDNEKMKKEISDNERAITSNTLRLEDLKKEISSQQLLIETIKSKTKEIE